MIYFLLSRLWMRGVFVAKIEYFAAKPPALQGNRPDRNLDNCEVVPAVLRYGVTR